MMAEVRIDGTVLVIGGAGAIGEETAYAFAEAGAVAIACADINEQKAKEVAKKSKSYAVHQDYRAVSFAVDIRSSSSVQQMIELVAKELGRIDHCVNAAGIGDEVHKAIYDSSMDEYENVLDINAKGVMTCTRAVTKFMLGQESRSITGRNGTRDIGRGSIVNLGSANSYAALPGKVAYVASKHAMMGITKTAALDCASKGVRVNAICPSWVRTPMVEEECSKNPILASAIAKMSPLGRVAELDEIVGVIIFLCSPSASYVTGTGLVVDAGLTLTVHMT